MSPSTTLFISPWNLPSGLRYGVGMWVLSISYISSREPIVTHLSVNPFSPTSVISPASSRLKSLSNAHCCITGQIWSEFGKIKRRQSYLSCTVLRQNPNSKGCYSADCQKGRCGEKGYGFRTRIVSSSTHDSCAAYASPCSRGSRHQESSPSAL